MSERPEGVDEWIARGRHVEIDGGSAFVVDVAAAQESARAPVLVLHGFPTCSFDWREVLPALSRDRRVVLFDFFGFGLSDKPDTRYSIRLYADQAERVAAALGLDTVALVTHDMGDTVGGELLARELEGTLRFGIERRVLSNGSIYIDMAHLTPGQQFLLSLDDARVALPSTGDDPGGGFKQGLASTFAAAHPASPAELDAQYWFVAQQGGNTLMARTIRYIEDRRAEEDRFTGAIERHPSPLGVVWGALDPVAVLPMVDRLGEARPGTPTVVLDDVGHYPMIEAPDAFARAVCDFLEPT
jgi:pimeloyl-ACP methyl ester carboxylesterase